MKKLLVVLAIILTIAGLAFGYSTVTSNLTWIYTPEQRTNMAKLECVWITASGATGGVSAAIPSHYTESLKGSYLVAAVTKPGSTTLFDASGSLLYTIPSAYNLTLVDEYGVDVLGGVGAGRSTTATEQVTPYVGALYGPRPVSGALTLTITSGGSAGTGTTILYFSRFR